ncbi:MAG: hypothetical protein WBD73_05770 [Candidatus Acidiferrales bacterium]
MKFAKRLLMVAGAVALSGIVSVMVAPKAVHAIVSTLVTVANTSANPVPVTEGKDLAYQPFVTSICKDSGDGSCATVASVFGLPSTLPDSFTVPATDSSGNTVKALVITFVAGACQGSPALATTVPTNAVNGVSVAIDFLSESAATVINQATTIVADPGSTVGIFDQLTAGNACFLTVHGYLAK